MKKIHVIGLAFAAVFAFSMVSASGASALSLWDQCTKTASPLEFTESDCITKGTPAEWGWEEIKAKTAIDSLVAKLLLITGAVEIECEGILEGTVGPGAEDEVTKLLNASGTEEVTSAKPVNCKILNTGGGLCTGKSATEEAWAFPVNLTWLTELLANGTDNLLGSGAGEPGWSVTCKGDGATNECKRAETELELANLEAELEVDLTFPKVAATCTNIFLKTGEVVGTVSILLVNGNALRAM